MPKPKTSQQIQQDAIAMGIKKIRNGCPECAEGYFNLAQQQGATEEDIRQAIAEATGTSSRGVSRRDVIKMAIASGVAAAGIATLSLTMQRNAPHADAYTPLYYGIDSNTNFCCGMPTQMYIGRMGYGIYPDKSYFAFNTSAANTAGHYNTFGYWGLQGPGASANSPYNWGVVQANAAWSAWESTFIGNAYVGGETVFADIEEGFGGWGTNITANQELLNTFLTQLYAITPAGVWPGVYVRPDFWNLYFGSSFTPSQEFVLWVVGVDECQVCGPCASCTTTLSDVRNLFFCIPYNTPRSVDKTPFFGSIGSRTLVVIIQGVVIGMFQAS
jgi:hypothetical protein